ncbi:MAG: BlaI/MecI/CopY family transcriptional regulator [Planctomycetaceae bacterium]|nr:BlaI/MecI/CopY family transcriptional regulator [Planctomycetaceae bacterium]
MRAEKKQYPTEKELVILQVLWANGPCTVRQVNAQICKKEKTGYTTTLKLMQIMTEKGLLMRDDSQFKHIYRPACTEEKTEKQIVSHMLNRVFAGSAEKLVMRALSAKHVTAEELKNIRKLIEEMEA